LKITFLGTGTSQGIPVIACDCEVCLSNNQKDKRLRTSAMIEIDGLTIVIDSGPDFRQQMLRENVKKLDAILFTHAHKDHTAGLDDIRAFNYVQQKPIDLYAETRVHDSLKMEFAYIFAEDHYPGIPEIKSYTIDEKPFYIENVLIEPIRVLHYKLAILGFKINDFVYITDANYIDNEVIEIIKNCNTFVINGLRHQKHISHFSLSEAIEIIKKVKPKQAFITHISHQLGLHQSVEASLPSSVHLAYDGLILKL